MLDFEGMANIVPDLPYVLLVETDQLLAESVGEALHASGFVPLLATDAIDAVNYMAGASAPVLVILDLDSLEKPAELLAHFRANARWARIPFVVTGSVADLPGELQVDGFLPKPFDAERLVSLAREHIARSRWKARARSLLVLGHPSCDQLPKNRACIGPGSSIERRKEMLGHCPVLVTERYAHLRPDSFSDRDRGTIALDLEPGSTDPVQLGTKWPPEPEAIA